MTKPQYTYDHEKADTDTDDDTHAERLKSPYA